MLNAAARLIFSARRLEHVTPLLRDLHWLNVECPGKKQVPSLCSGATFATWHRAAVTESPRHYNYNGPPTFHVVIFDLPLRRLWSSLRPVVLHLTTERFRWLPYASETLCRPHCEQSSQLRRSGTQARIQKCGLGDRVPKHSNGGGRGIPLPIGDGVWKGSVPLPQKNFSMFSFEMVHFDAFWRTF